MVWMILVNMVSSYSLMNDNIIFIQAISLEIVVSRKAKRNVSSYSSQLKFLKLNLASSCILCVCVEGMGLKCVWLGAEWNNIRIGTHIEHFHLSW